jgi:membrane protease subunit HflK
MRRAGASAELARLAAPLLGVLDVAWRRMHWWIAAMALLYAVSGISVIRSDEVAVVLRFGRLVGESPALREHGPGLLFALPKPIDQVVRVQTKRVRELEIRALAPPDGWWQSGPTLDPLRIGYALSGDQNVVHVVAVARYRVRDPAEFVFYGPDAETILRVEVSAALVRSLGEMPIDRILADGRKDLIATAARRTQAGLDAAHAGLELVSIELTSLRPPTALSRDFEEVQSAYIGAETRKEQAQAEAQEILPRAHAEADAAVQRARGEAAAALATAHGDAAAFAALAREYQASPVVAHERLYRDAVEKALGAAGSIRWVPPPAGGRYNGLRITLAPSGQATATPTFVDDDEPG